MCHMEASVCAGRAGPAKLWPAGNSPGQNQPGLEAAASGKVAHCSVWNHNREEDKNHTKQIIEYNVKYLKTQRPGKVDVWMDRWMFF